MSKMQNLQQALKQSSGKTPVVEVVKADDAVAAKQMPVPAARTPSRSGQFNLSSWQPMAFKSSLRLVQARKGGNVTIQDLMAEALNDLFTKYDVPTVRQE
jgi:hypothetical protein